MRRDERVSLPAAEKGGGEKGPFSVAAWGAARGLVSAARVFTGVLAARRDEAVNITTDFYL